MSGQIKSIRTIGPDEVVIPPRACRSERLWGVAAMLKSYVAAKLSGRLPEGDPIVEERLRSCRSCSSYCDDGKKTWCGACGCGSNRKEAIISGGEGPSKLTFVKLGCPKKMPGFSNGED